MTSHTPAGDDFDRVADAELVERMAPEPVAGEVEVVAWRHTTEHRRPYRWPWSYSTREPTRYPIREPLVTKSSYDALAAAKDRLEKINADHCRTINTYVIDNARLADRAEAAERQRDALREAAIVVRDWADSIASSAPMFQALRTALKDEGSAT